MYLVSIPSTNNVITEDWGEVLRLIRIYPNCRYTKVNPDKKINFNLTASIEQKAGLYKVGRHISKKYVQIKCFFEDNVTYVSYITHGLTTFITTDVENVKIMRKGNITNMVYKGIVSKNGLIGTARAIIFALSNIGEFVDVEIVVPTISELYMFWYSGGKIVAFSKLIDVVTSRVGRVCITVQTPQYYGG